MLLTLSFIAAIQIIRVRASAALWPRSPSAITALPESEVPDSRPVGGGMRGHFRLTPFGLWLAFKEFGHGRSLGRKTGSSGQRE